jgi:glucose-1-phosphate adenylyltransferase
VQIPPHTEIGYDPELDLARGFVVTDKGVTVIPKSKGTERFQEEPPR